MIAVFETFYGGTSISCSYENTRPGCAPLYCLFNVRGQVFQHDMNSKPLN